MSNYYLNRKYFVYRHVAPNSKMYIGITSKLNPEDRWGKDGKGYIENAHFWNAIQKYGWNNFKHIIVAHNLDVDTACHLEEYLIKKYDTMNNGYNQTSGGVRPTEITDEIRDKISVKIRAYHNSLSEGEWSEKFKGHVVSESCKKKLSLRMQGRKFSEDVIKRRVITYKANLTPEIRYKIGNSMRGKHLSEEHKQKLRKANVGKTVSASTRKKIGENAKQRFSIKHVWVHNDNEELEIPEYKLSEYLAIGYALGRINIKNTYLTKDNITIKVNISEIDKYLAKGWVRGFKESRHENIRKSKQKFVYFYKDIKFSTGEELASYLRNNGYPKIVQGTVNLICLGREIQAYPELSSEITRRRICENI